VTILTWWLRQGLNEGGFVEGRNVAIEYRWAERQIERLPALTADLIYHRVSVIVPTGGATTAAIATTGTIPIPIVTTFGGDPVKLGYAESLNRPGKNVTGVGVFRFGGGAPPTRTLIRQFLQ
jgi:ABC-type uncharacterized transport system substrate-binding protein